MLRWVFVLVSILIIGLACSADAQKKPTIPRMGILQLGVPPNPNLTVFIQALRELGHIEGKNISFEYRFANAKAERLPELAAELVSMRVDTIFTAGTPAIMATKNSTTSIPVVFFSTSDPVGTGVVASLAHPGGNITGITVQASDLWPKRLELLKEIASKLSRVAMLWNKEMPGWRSKQKPLKKSQDRCPYQYKIEG